VADKGDEWRGVTLLGREMTLSRSSALPYTAYILGASFPSEIEWYATEFRLTGTIQALSLDDRLTFDPHLFPPKGTSLPSGYRRLSAATDFDSDYVVLYTRDPIRIYALGAAPIVAWLPAHGSNVSLDFTDQFRSKIVETYGPGPEPKQQDGKLVHEHWEAPIAEVVGPAVVTTTDISAVLLRHGSAPVLLNVGPNKNMIAALTLRPPFSTRIVSLPVGE
jgi:hypothetical protein